MSIKYKNYNDVLNYFKKYSNVEIFATYAIKYIFKLAEISLMISIAQNYRNTYLITF